MIRQFTGLLFLFTVLIFAAGAIPAAGNGFSHHLKMQGTVTKGIDGGYYMDIVLKNDSDQPVSISAVKLPWAPDHWDSWIKGFRLDAGKTQLEPGGALVDYGGQVVIKPKDTLKGRVALHAMFRTLIDDVNSHGVAIEWRCPTELVPVSCTMQASRVVVSKTGIREETPKATSPLVR